MNICHFPLLLCFKGTFFSCIRPSPTSVLGIYNPVETNYLTRLGCCPLIFDNIYSNSIQGSVDLFCNCPIDSERTALFLSALGFLDSVSQIDHDIFNLNTDLSAETLFFRNT